MEPTVQTPSFDGMYSFFRWSYDSVLELVVDILEEMDPRVDDWALMSSPVYPLGVVLFYLVFIVSLGPIVMKGREALNINSSLVLYNFLALALNFFMAASLISLLYQLNYSVKCQRVRFRSLDPREDEIAVILWVFHVSKIVEMADTLFIILRQKSGHLTFLHVYHHSTIVIASWIGVRFVPGGSTAVIALVNSWVHVIMYTYYKLSTLKWLGLGKSYSYKKFVTIVQLSQFVFTIYICGSSLSMGQSCGFPRWVSAWLMLYMMTFMILFGNFYVTTYYPTVDENNSSVSTKSKSSKNK